MWNIFKAVTDRGAVASTFNRDLLKPAVKSPRFAVVVVAAAVVALSPTPAIAASGSASCLGQGTPIDVHENHPFGTTVVSPFATDDAAALSAFVTSEARNHDSDQCVGG